MRPSTSDRNVNDKDYDELMAYLNSLPPEPPLELTPRELEIQAAHRRQAEIHASLEADRAKPGTVLWPPPGPEVTSSPPSLAAPAMRVATTTTPAAPIVEPGAYAFPKSPRFAGLLKTMRTKSAQELLTFIELASDKPASYAALREPFCAASIALNETRSAPPRIRRTRSLPPGRSALVPEQVQLSNDRQVIDLHWLHARGLRGSPEAKWAELLSSPEFLFDRASTFVITLKRAESKAEALGLTLREQLELAVIQTTQARNAWRDISNQYRAVDAQARADRSKPRPPVKLLNMVADAYLALRIASGSIQAAVEAGGLFHDRAFTADELRRARRWLIDRRLLRP